MNAIKLISAEAKKIQKDHPRLSWQDCIRQASQIYKLRKRKVSGTKKVVEKSAPSLLSRKRKTAAPKMKAVKIKPAVKRGTHTDTKSHNVRINVLSGTDMNFYYDLLDNAYTRLRNDEDLYKLTKSHKLTEGYTKADKSDDLRLTKQKIIDTKWEIKLLRNIIINKTKKI
jgi:hypothetical protein